MIRKALIFSIFLVFTFPVLAQDVWEVPEKDKENISVYTFNEDFVLAGQFIYEYSCTSCHGTPEKANFATLSPSPGDVSSERFLIQKDGELFFKIKTGRGSMPSFADAFSDEEIWNLVSYIRSFHKNYKQPIPDLKGIEIPKFSLTMDFDENVDKIVIKVFNEDSTAAEGIDVSAFVKSLFGKFSLGKSITNRLGIAYFDIDTKIPGDSAGNLEIIAKAVKGYGSAKLQKKMQVVEPTFGKSAIVGNHLWSKRINAPFWLQVIFHVTVFGVWAAIFFILFGLRKIKKLS